MTTFIEVTANDRRFLVKADCLWEIISETNDPDEKNTLFKLRNKGDGSLASAFAVKEDGE